MEISDLEKLLQGSTPGPLEASGNGVHRRKSAHFAECVAICYDPDQPSQVTDACRGNARLFSVAHSLAAELLSLKQQNTGPRRIVLSGSSRFVDIMAVCMWLLERDEGAIAMGLHLLPRWYPNCPDDHLAEHEGIAAEMDELHLRKIDLCDEVFVVNYEDYIGSSTRKEIEYALAHKKPIRWFTHDPIGEKVKAMLKPSPPIAKQVAG